MTGEDLKSASVYPTLSLSVFSEERSTIPDSWTTSCPAFAVISSVSTRCRVFSVKSLTNLLSPLEILTHGWDPSPGKESILISIPWWFLVTISNTRPIFVFPRIQPLGVENSSSRSEVYSRHPTVKLKVFVLCKSYLTKIRLTLDKNPQQCMILLCSGSILTTPVSMMSEYKETDKDVYRIGKSSSTCTHDLDLEPMSLKQNLHKKARQICLLVTQQRKGKQSHISHQKGKWQQWRNVVVTNRRYFRRHGCPCWEDLCRWPHYQEKCDCHVVSLCVWSELFQSADCLSERSRVSSGLHSCQAEDEDEAVRVQDDCFHLAESHSSSLFLWIFCFLAASLASSFASDLPR